MTLTFFLPLQSGLLTPYMITLHHQTATSLAEKKTEKHEGTDMWKSEAGVSYKCSSICSQLSGGMKYT